MFPYNQMMQTQGMISPTHGLFNQPTDLTSAFQPQGGFGAFLQQLFGNLPGGQQMPMTANPVQGGFGGFMQRPTLESLGATGLGSSFYQQPDIPQGPQADWSFADQPVARQRNRGGGREAAAIRAMHAGDQPDVYKWKLDRLGGR